MGYDALVNGTGHSNTAIGALALCSANSAQLATAVGYKALFVNTSSQANTGIGCYSGLGTTTGTMDTYLGFGSGTNVSTGSSNTCIGAQNGEVITTGGQNTLVGHLCETSASGASNQTVMGYNVTSVGDDNFTFGNATTDSNIASGATSITAPSDIRLKEDIQDEVVGLDFINELRPVTFRWKKEKDVPEELVAHGSGSEKRVMNGKYNHGFISQEVKEVIDNNPDIKEGFDMWSEDDVDGRQRIGEGALIPMLVKSIQELSAEVEELKAKLEE